MPALWGRAGEEMRVQVGGWKETNNVLGLDRLGLTRSCWLAMANSHVAQKGKGAACVSAGKGVRYQHA